MRQTKTKEAQVSEILLIFTYLIISVWLSSLPYKNDILHKTTGVL